MSKELKDLAMNDQVRQTMHDAVPVAVEYSMTTYGRSLEKVIAELRNWGIRHRKRFIEKPR